MPSLFAILNRPEVKSRLPRLIVGGLALIVLLAVGSWALDRARWQSTDNAYVKADTVIVSPQLDGYVARVLVDDNQQVATGQVLVEIDPAEVRARVAQAQASLAAAEAATRNADARAAVARSMIAERQASIASAQAQARLSRSELSRYTELATRGWVAQQRVQTQRAQNDQATAGVRQAEAAYVAQQREASASVAERAQVGASVQQARAMLDQAKIDLDHATIRASGPGVIGARGVRAGQFVRQGANLMSIVPLGETYVVANFKETQVARMRIGQAVEIRADAFGNQRIIGHVESFSPATGSEFALIPVENATGNFTKIVQRVPVKIAVDPAGSLADALRPGLSIKVKVDLHSRGGATFAESATHASAEDGARGASVATASK